MATPGYRPGKAGPRPDDHGNRDAPAGRQTILVVEDDEDVRLFVTEFLDDLGYRVLSAANGRLALDILREGSTIDLLFTDLVMPGGVTGKDLAAAAATMRPGLKILLTSGYAGHRMLEGQPLRQDDDFIEKPYRPARLATRIKTLLDS